MITVFTPTYNRKKELEALYESLIKQTNKDFEWLIVDDGSFDNTKEYIEKCNQEWSDE
jgi:glycosyltransferase involved in cell wall biosynthesis